VRLSESRFRIEGDKTIFERDADNGFKMQIPTKSPADSEMMSPGDTR